MTKQTSYEKKDPIAAAVLRLAALGWEKVTIAAVAKSAKIPAATLSQKFAAPADLVCVVAEHVDGKAFAALGKISGSVHDRLFDVLMARFDFMQRHRKAIVIMADAARHDRALSCALARAALDGAYRVIDAAQLREPFPRPAVVIALVAVYGWAFWVWRRDDSRDMGKTMAALDRSLRWAGRVAAFITPRS